MRPKAGASTLQIDIAAYIQEEHEMQTQNHTAAARINCLLAHSTRIHTLCTFEVCLIPNATLAEQILICNVTPCET